jgi:putative SOS response-associated peptidase YedK
MCYNVKQTSKLEVLLKRFKAKKGITTTLDFTPVEEMTGFLAKGEIGKLVRVITNDCPEDIQVFRWGLIPAYAKDMSIDGYNLNAKIETLHEKVTYAESMNRRCLILVDGFYEHQHLGKERLKHLVTAADGEPFAFAGIWREAMAPNGEITQSCAIVTTEAQGIMREIHNSALRMPVILARGTERDWLTEDLNTFRAQLNDKITLDLVATLLPKPEPATVQGSLFG